MNTVRNRIVNPMLETDFYKTSNFPLFDNKKNSGVTTLYDKPLSLFEFSFIDYFSVFEFIGFPVMSYRFK